MAATKLFEFSFATLKQYANDPTSSEFIPLVMHNTSGITPVQADSFNMGTFDNEDGGTVALTIMGAYAASNDGTTEPNPANKYPTVDLEDVNHVKKVVVAGLNNVLIQNFSSYVYDNADAKIKAVIPLSFNEWSVDGNKLTNKSSGKSYNNSPISAADLPFLNVSSPFHIVQSFLFYPGGDETKPGEVKTATLDGSLSFNIPNLQVNGTLEITVSETGHNRTGLKMNVVSLELVAPPDMQFTDIAVVKSPSTDKIYQKILNQAITEILDSQTGTQGILKNIAAVLNSADNLSKINNLLNEKFTDIVNDKLGTVASASSIGPYDGPADGNQIDYYMFDRIRYALNTPGSPWYVQTMLKNYQNPSLNPFKPQNLDIGSFTIPKVGVTLKNITLSNIVVSGMPNAAIPKNDMKLGPPLYLTLVLGANSPYTTATATFAANYTGGSLKLGLKITIKGCEIASTIASSGPTADKVVITVEALNFSVPSTDDLNLTLDDQSGMGAFVQKILNTPAIQNQIVSAVNTSIGEHLAAISTELTKIAKSIFSKAIG